MAPNLLDYLNGAIRAELARRRIPQRALAERLGISATQVSERLYGRVSWNVSELETVADFLDVPVHQLFPISGGVAA